MKQIQCVYINLDGAGDRRALLEPNFAAHRGQGWTLARCAAVDAEDVRAQGIPGSLPPAAKACFLSHRKAIASQLGSMHPAFILEDDALLGPHTAELVDKVVFANDNLAWDVLFTDICVPQISSMLHLIQLRRQLSIPTEVRLIDLHRFTFAGATAYIVNAGSIAKVHALLNGITAFDVPYDLQLRNLIHQGRLRAFAFFPFLTSLSESAEASQVQGEDGKSADMVWNLFRKLVWVDRSLEQHRPALSMIDRTLCDDEARAFATLFGAMASSTFVDK